MGRTDAVIFDLYNTLLDNRTDEEREDTYEFLSLWLSYHGVRIKPAPLRRLYLDLCHQEMSQAVGPHPDIEIGKVFSAILALRGEEPVPALLVAEMALLFRIRTTDRLSPFPGAFPLLETLKGRVKLAIASNAQRLFTIPELTRFAMAEYFDAIVFSSDVGVCKPHPKLFNRALEALSLQPERAIFVGDNLEADIGGAQGAGMKAVWVNRGRETGDAEGLTPDYEARSDKELRDLLLSLI